MPEITNRLCRRAHSVVISGHVTRHMVDFSNYTDFSRIVHHKINEERMLYP